QQVFRALIQLAKEVNLPIAIHTREAWQDTLKILEEVGPPARNGVFHCFGEGISEAKAALDLGFYISVPGIVTFKKSGNLIPVIETIPIERILVETDSPFLAPMPHRGKRNEPAFVKFIGEKIAEIKKLPVEEVARVTTENARRLFNLSLRGMK
ncbi:MAG: TatD family hydrolase, partial [Deltaproteobacteria bacterium]|nr:TatD family hydrolase [Deltaproteobacteria bacterium]